jgi:Protein of unknown function (DUF2892)
MPQNIGKIDRAIRLAIGTILVLAGTVVFSNMLVTVAGLILFLTGVVRFCALYKLIGVDTNKPCGCKTDDSCDTKAS